jgi:diguanylate cyclase (GGDEF)-like protein
MYARVCAVLVCPSHSCAVSIRLVLRFISFAIDRPRITLVLDWPILLPLGPRKKQFLRAARVCLRRNRAPNPAETGALSCRISSNGAAGKDTLAKNLRARPISIFLVEDNQVDLALLRELVQDLPMPVSLYHAENLKAAVAQLGTGTYDIILLDLGLPESFGLPTFEQLHEQYPDLPIIVLTGLSDEEVALAAVQQGAQDYLNKSEINIPTLTRAIRYAIERNRLTIELRNASITDALTGLYNRRGFELLAGQQIKAAVRGGQLLNLLYVDMDGLKWINDNLGHQEGDRALVDVAVLLRATCRSSDIIARLSGDEFAILVYCDKEVCGHKVWRRLQEQIEEHNRRVGRPYRLALSAGVVEFDPQQPISLHQLLDRADAMMYEEKNRRRHKNRD